MLALSMLAYGQTIAEVACGTNGLSTLCTAINESPTVLAALSAAGTYTVFAPNNDAFAAVLSGAALTDLLADEPSLTNLLLKHALDSKVDATTALTLNNDRVATMQGNELTAFETLTWSAQSNEEGEYPDATMLIAVIQGNVDNSFDGNAPGLSYSVETAGKKVMEDEAKCPLLSSGEISIAMGNPPAPCYKLKFPCEMETEDGHEHCHATAHTAVWTIPNPSGYKNIAIFAQHYPTEFERSLHYLKGPGGEDIEPVNEMPEPEEREKRWGAAIGAAFIVMVCTLIGVIFLAPLFAKLQKEREALVNVLASAFAAGALLAAAFYLMLYEATHLIAITDDRTEAQASAWWGSATLLGFVSPFILEAIVSAVIGKAAPKQEVRKEADAEAAKPAAVVPAPNSRNKVRVLSGVLLGDFLHNLVDGFFIGAAFANCDSSMAWTITAATVYHELAQEISDYLVLTNPEQGGLKPFMALGLNFLSGMSVLFGVCIVLSAEPSNFSTGCLLAYGAGVYLQLAATECMPRVHEYATTLNMRLGGLLLFIIGATAIGLVLLDHEHCAGEGGHEGHGH
ncbi:hypothetical protein EMIHUDRAFT_105494 [Emiliania huxleyi CCMP1516]|uniref:FAS1 domain-containing protein n=2 Tax=Emiliania huxleyi TaxID=2903 RepID=A0A0D3IES3_EMIH1|nr:hypothetical protein EMIHUDRAFT_105494 [Emiliania huxleyi CCMP1516]EOD09758.1 hypothetical protein EMIHUDRAFT_105494 [Emiliania huxleyi CCMP1516]|eukprot:XP_005762187.1 hypothetical protein EMIHUDRAFT_105494 [Emiliania huxleyi CCMP1516]